VTPKSSLTPDDYDAIRAILPAMIAALSRGDSWDQAEANRLMIEADALVEHWGVEGQCPEIVNAAAMVVSANATKDMETLRFACSEFELVVRNVASRERRKNT